MQQLILCSPKRRIHHSVNFLLLITHYAEHLQYVRYHTDPVQPQHITGERWVTHVPNEAHPGTDETQLLQVKFSPSTYQRNYIKAIKQCCLRHNRKAMKIFLRMRNQDALKYDRVHVSPTLAKIQMSGIIVNDSQQPSKQQRRLVSDLFLPKPAISISSTQVGSLLYQTEGGYHHMNPF